MNRLLAEKAFSYTGHTGAIYALEESPQAGVFFSGSGDHLIVSWNVNNRDEGTVVSSLPGIVYSLKYYPDKKLLFAGQSLGNIHLISFESKKEIRSLAYHTDAVFDLLLLEKQGLLVSAGGDGLIQFIALDDFRLIKTIDLGKQKIRCLAEDPSGKNLIAGSQDGKITVVSLDDLSVVQRLQAHQQGFSVNSALFIRQGTLLVTGSRDACLNVFDVKNNFALLQSIPAHYYAIYHLIQLEGTTHFASASRDKSIKIWDSESLSVLLKIDSALAGHINSVNRLLYLPSNGLLLSAGDDRAINEWIIS